MARRMAMALGLAAVLALGLALPGLAQEKVVRIALPQDFTVVYSFAVEEYNQGQRDYLQLVNKRGGIGGYRFEALVTDTGNQPQRGIEAYERYKRQGAIIFDFISTPVSKAVLPRVMQDELVLVTPLSGRADAADGSTFRWVFPVFATYWSQAAVITRYIHDVEGGNLSGKRIALVHIDSPFGREPIPVFQELGRRLGFELGLFPYPSPGTEQSATWTQVRRFRPDWIVLWGAGVNQPVSVREAIRSGFRMDRVVSVVWLSETDMATAGPQQARGVQRFEAVQPGREAPWIRAILEEVYAAGLGTGPEERVGRTYYNIGVASMAAMVEAVRQAHERFGEPITADKVRRGFEQLRAFDAGGLMAPVTITPEDHEGGGTGRISQWDGTRWVPKTGWYSAYRDVVWDLVRQHAAEFRQGIGQ